MDKRVWNNFIIKVIPLMLHKSIIKSSINRKRSKKSQIKPPKSIQKAIPGGKYGCA